MRRGPFFFFFFFFFFSFAFHFSKRRKFVLGLPKWNFSTGKKAFHAGKKIRKNDFAPSEKFLLRPCIPSCPAVHARPFFFLEDLVFYTFGNRNNENCKISIKLDR